MGLDGVKTFSMIKVMGVQRGSCGTTGSICGTGMGNDNSHLMVRDIFRKKLPNLLTVLLFWFVWFYFLQ